MLPGGMGSRVRDFDRSLDTMRDLSAAPRLQRGFAGWLALLVLVVAVLLLAPGFRWPAAKGQRKVPPPAPVVAPPALMDTQPR